MISHPKSTRPLGAVAWAALALAIAPTVALAKLPAPSAEAKAKADEAKLKTAHGDKVSAYKLCLAQNHAADKYRASMKSAGKETKPPVDTPACTDPGAFDLAAAQAAAAAAASAAAAAAAAPASAPVAAK